MRGKQSEVKGDRKEERHGGYSFTLFEQIVLIER